MKSKDLVKRVNKISLLMEYLSDKYNSNFITSELAEEIIRHEALRNWNIELNFVELGWIITTLKSNLNDANY